MAKRITAEEQAIIKDMRLKGYGPTAIGNKLGRSKKTMQRQFEKLGLPNDLNEAGIERKDCYPVLKTIKCKRCGKDYDTKRFNAKFCSEKCRTLHNKRMIAPKVLCIGCNESFRTYKNRSFCSNECRHKHYERSRNVNRRIIIRRIRCKGCDEVFYSKRERMYCTSQCAYENRYVSQARTHSIKCRECGKHKTVPFIRKSFCSSECSRKYGYRVNEVKRRSRILSNGDVNWDINIARLISRDGLKCYICDEDVEIYKDINHDMYPSIEHVIPIAKGGTHTWDNVKLAHRKCNWEKGTEILEEQITK